MYKRIIPFLAAAVALAFGCSHNCDDNIPVRVSWDGASLEELTSFEVEGRDFMENDLYYPRIRSLSDGSLMMTFMNHKFGWDIYVTKSFDGGVSWTPAKLVRESGWVDSPFGRDIRSSVNPDFLELASGRIIMAFQTRYLDHYHDFSVTNDACWIEVMFSDDKGIPLPSLTGGVWGWVFPFTGGVWGWVCSGWGCWSFSFLMISSVSTALAKSLDRNTSMCSPRNWRPNS